MTIIACIQLDCPNKTIQNIKFKNTFAYIDYKLNEEIIKIIILMYIIQNAISNLMLSMYIFDIFKFLKYFI